jgi:hypothetical protein
MAPATLVRVVREALECEASAPGARSAEVLAPAV